MADEAALLDPAEAPEYPGDVDTVTPDLVDPENAPEFPGEIGVVTFVDRVLNKAKAICAAVGGSAAYEAANTFLPEGPVKHWAMGVGIPAAAALGAFLARNRGQIDVLVKDAFETVEEAKHRA